MDRQLIAIFHGLNDFIDIAEIKTGVQPLRIHIQRQRDEVDIARAFTIAEQATFNPVAARQQAKFRRGDPAAPVIMRMQADDNRITRADMFAHPFDLVRIYIGHRSFDGGGQIQDQWLGSGRLQNLHHSLAYLKAEFELGSGKGFGAIFEMPVGFGEARGLLHQHMRAFNRDGLHPSFVEVEDNVPPRGADGIIQMDDRTRRARHAFERFLNKVAP